MCDQSPPPPPPHVLIFTLPLQGPINCMLKFAEILCLDDIKVTFLITQSVQQKCADARIYLAKYPNFSFETVPAAADDDPTAHCFWKLVEAIEAEAVPVFRDMVTSGAYAPDSGNPVTCIIADAIFSFATNIAKNIGVPFLYFDTISPSCAWVDLCLPHLIAAKELPFQDDNLDEVIISDIIRRRDLPHFCRTKDVNHPELQLVLKEVGHIPLSQGLILNTFHELDAPVLSQIRDICPNIYTVGPLHAHLKTRIAREMGQEIQASQSSTSFWKEDRSCIYWLNEQPLKSVIYVSIGSLAVMTPEQLLEIWYGLVKSGSRFLWVRRPGSVTGHDFGSDQIPLELNIGTQKRGCIVSWAPQEEVLAHHAIGGFLTHSGWNSTLESIVEGKPMICWPSHADQQVNSRYVGEVWKLGLDMKDTCDRVIIEKMIREVMESRKDEFLNRAEEMAKLAKLSVSEGGSSFNDLDRLIGDIKMMISM